MTKPSRFIRLSELFGQPTHLFVAEVIRRFIVFGFGVMFGTAFIASGNFVGIIPIIGFAILALERVDGKEKP